MSVGQLISALASLALVLAAVLAARPLVARLLSMGMLGRGLGAGRATRLAVVQVLPVDHSRRLLLLRCDGREFLVLVGARDVFLGRIDGGGDAA
jgi:flagellar protein FliO/FliZ